MDAVKQERLLSRSRSTGFLDRLDNEFDFKCFSARFCGSSGSDHGSVSSVEPCAACGARAWQHVKLDSGIGRSSLDDDALFALERKVDKLSELLQEQRNLLLSLKDQVIGSKAGDITSKQQFTANTICGEEIKAEELINTNETTKDAVIPDLGDIASGSSGLLPVEMKQHVSLDHIIRVALENFLQSDSVRAHVAASTAECVRGAVQGGLGRSLGAAYLPLVQRSHRRLVSHVTKLLDDSFADLEESTSSLFKSIHKTSKSLRQSLEKHQNLLEKTDPFNNMKLLSSTLKGVLEEELRTWRERVVQELTSRAVTDGADSEPEPPPEWTDYSPTSPLQPPNPDTSVIDNLMRCAVIKKHVEDGDVAGAFEEALSSGDLALVMAACRAAGSASGATAALRPAALLALLQQLATDMVHDTQLKCRYLEETILRLEKSDAATREHLPLVVQDVRRHLARFLRCYPKHRAGRRVALILMATDSLT